MASTASTSERTVRAQAREAGPLPRKVGEFGYVTPKDGDAHARPSMDDIELCGRHPADTPYRDRDAAATPVSRAAPAKPKRLLDRLTSRDAQPLAFGLQGPSLGRLLFILCLLSITIGGWVLTIRRVNAAADSDADDTADQDADDQVTPGATYVFIHLAFAIATLLELVFLERAVYRLRAERWRWLHPGQTPRDACSGPPMGIAPWTRPSLPTYAAALGERGTGDVEDAAIAGPAPPEYGNTRGSTLLSFTAMASSLLRRPSTRSTMRRVEEGPDSRPGSVRHRDADADTIANAIRERQMELALSSLEQGEGTQATQRS